MTYAKKYGNYGIFTDEMVYQWFKTLGNAKKEWDTNFADPECAEDWLDEYEEVQLRNMRTGEVLAELHQARR